MCLFHLSFISPIFDGTFYMEKVVSFESKIKDEINEDLTETSRVSYKGKSFLFSKN